MPISKRLRFEILKRDGFRCRYCGAGADDHDLAIDHVVPESLGGSSLPDNLVAACVDCNAGKSSTNLDDASVEEVAGDALRWARAIRIVAKELTTDSPMLIRSATEGIIAFYEEATGNSVPRDAAGSIQRFIERGLTPEIMQGHVLRTASRSLFYSASWKYFCGCCWRSIKELEDAARQYIATEDSLKGGE